MCTDETQSRSEQPCTRHLQLSRHCSSLGDPLLSQLGIWGPCAPSAPAECSIPDLGWHWASAHRFHWAGQARGTCGRRLIVPRVPQRNCSDSKCSVSSSSSILTQQRLLLKHKAPGFQDGTFRPSVLVRCHNRTGGNRL